jgi:3-hydroxybutyryl-CoA dehydrogenase
MDAERNAVIVGGGTMGSGIGAIFVAHGWDLQVVEPAPAARTALPDRLMDACRAMGRAEPRGKLSVRARLTDVDWKGVSLVIESAPEDLGIKRAVFSDLERIAPTHVPLASNSSSFPISDIARNLASRSRMLGLHFFMPAHLVPAVEVVRSEATDEAVAQGVSAIMRTLGMKPVQVKKDVPGFLANRIQHAMMREAIALVDEGFATAEDVDIAVRYGFGFRFVAAGPLLQKDLAGLDIHCAAATTLYPHLRCDKAPAPLLQRLVARGDIGMKAPSRRGFYDWDDASIARERKRYETALRKALAILRDEDGG